MTKLFTILIDTLTIINYYFKWVNKRRGCEHKKIKRWLTLHPELDDYICTLTEIGLPCLRGNCPELKIK